MECYHLDVLFFGEDFSWCRSCGALRAAESAEWEVPSDGSDQENATPYGLRGLHLKDEENVLIRFIRETGSETEILLTRDTGIGLAGFLRMMCEQKFSKKRKLDG